MGCGDGERELPEIISARTIDPVPPPPTLGKCAKIINWNQTRKRVRRGRKDAIEQKWAEPENGGGRGIRAFLFHLWKNMVDLIIWKLPQLTNQRNGMSQNGKNGRNPLQR